MKSTVYFIDLKTTSKESLLDKLKRLIETAGISRIIKKRDLVAIKLHFGEWGNTAFIRPVFIGQIAETIRTAGGDPFLTDTNTLYSGSRSEAPAHLITAMKNGFSFSAVQAPLIIADGLRGKSETFVPINQKRFEGVYIGTAIAQADALVSVAHFKGHEITGFGGALKNVGMGGASRRGKLAQHSTVHPMIVAENCIGCGDCVSHCSQSALSVVNKKANLDAAKCIGCGECILMCANEAIEVEWDQDVPVFMENMMEYALGVLRGKQKKAFYINFITDVSPACDCYANNDAPIVRNIGIVASTDPVAIDKASVDLVNQEPALPDSCLTSHRSAGDDKFKGIYPEINWEYQLDYAQKIGLGTSEYALEKI